MPLKSLGSLHLPLTYLLLSYHDVKRSLQPHASPVMPCAWTTGPKAVGPNNHGPKPSETETKPPFAVLAVRCVQLLCHHEGKAIQNTLIRIRKSCQREFLFHFVFAVL